MKSIKVRSRHFILRNRNIKVYSFLGKALCQTRTQEILLLRRCSLAMAYVVFENGINGNVKSSPNGESFGIYTYILLGTFRAVKMDAVVATSEARSDLFLL